MAPHARRALGGLSIASNPNRIVGTLPAQISQAQMNTNRFPMEIEKRTLCRQSMK
jgi:hypothetical protein